MNASDKTHSDPKFILFGTPEIPRKVKEDDGNRISGTAEQGVWLYSDDTQTGSRFGFWDCSEGEFRAKMDGFTEFCHIIEGEAEITCLNDGSSRTVRAGDSFVMEDGLELHWRVPVYVKKCFAISNVV